MPGRELHSLISSWVGFTCWHQRTVPSLACTAYSWSKVATKSVCCAPTGATVVTTETGGGSWHLFRATSSEADDGSWYIAKISSLKNACTSLICWSHYRTDWQVHAATRSPANPGLRCGPCRLR